MAIDSKNKRVSVQAYTFGLMRPTPNGSIDAADRATVSWLYSGIGVVTPVSPNYISIASNIAKKIVQKIAFYATEIGRDLD